MRLYGHARCTVVRSVNPSVVEVQYDKRCSQRPKVRDYHGRRPAIGGVLQC
jgi:hypothetical protein